MLFGDEAASSTDWAKTGVLGLVITNLATLGGLLLKYVRDWRLDNPDIAGKKQKVRKDATKLDISSADWILDKYQAMYDSLLVRVEAAEHEHTKCREENSMLKERTETQSKQIAALKIAVTELRKRVGDPGTGEHELV